MRVTKTMLKNGYTGPGELDDTVAEFRDGNKHGLGIDNTVAGEYKDNKLHGYAVSKLTGNINYYTEGKIKKKSENISLELKKTKDILSHIGKDFSHKLVVGFAAESKNLIENARNKLVTKNLDIIVGNEIKHSMGKTRAKMVIIDQYEERYLPEAEKEEQSRIILEHIFKFFMRVKTHDTIN